MWDWWDKTVEAVSDWSGDAWDRVNKAVDTYVWDTTENEAVAESWVRDTFNIPDQEGKGFVSEAWDKVNEVVDTYVWDTTEKEAVAEGWVRQMYDVPDQEGKGFIEEATEKATENITTIIDNTKTIIEKGRDTVTTYYDTISETLGDIINNIEITLGVGLEAAFAALASLPEALVKVFSINLEDFVEDGLKLYAANKALVERIKAEEGVK